MRNLTQKFYERYWRNPEDVPVRDPTTAKRLKLLFATLKKMGMVKRVLDAGCGAGFFTNAILKKGYGVVGVDVSKNAITQAHRKYPQIQFICSLLDCPLPFKDSVFDVVFSTETIEHVFGIYDMFSEINRVLKKEGVLILTSPYHGLIKNFLIVLFTFERHFNDIEGGHIRFFTKRVLDRLLRKFGFAVIETKYIGYLMPIAKSIYIVARKIDDVR